MLNSLSDYVHRREAYNYSDPDVEFTITPTLTRTLACVGAFRGIFPRRVPPSHATSGVNLRRFERICQLVFEDCSSAMNGGHWCREHLCNLKEVVCAVVHWKMASQGGRSRLNVRNVLAKWSADTSKKLLHAYHRRELSLFCIGGVRIPTASAFLRFLCPQEFGIIDSRVGAKVQAAGITTLSIREDGYINDTPTNRRKYHCEYVRFLRSEAMALSGAGGAFADVDENGMPIMSPFRPCDVEMALF